MAVYPDVHTLAGYEMHHRNTNRCDRDLCWKWGGHWASGGGQQQGFLVFFFFTACSAGSSSPAAGMELSDLYSSDHLVDRPTSTVADEKGIYPVYLRLFCLF
jgi:hypothetical protein